MDHPPETPLLKKKKKKEEKSYLVAPQHALNKISQWAPEILPVRQPVFIDEEDIVFEAGVQVWLKAEVDDDGVVVAVDVCVHPI